MVIAARQPVSCVSCGRRFRIPFACVDVELTLDLGPPGAGGRRPDVSPAGTGPGTPFVRRNSKPSATAATTIDSGLVVLPVLTSRCGCGRNRGVALDTLVHHDAAERLPPPQRERVTSSSSTVLDLALDTCRLDCGAKRYDLVRLTVMFGSPATWSARKLLPGGDSRVAADEDTSSISFA